LTKILHLSKANQKTINQRLMRIAREVEKESNFPSFSLLCRGYIAPRIYTFNIEIETCGA